MKVKKKKKKVLTDPNFLSTSCQKLTLKKEKNLINNPNDNKQVCYEIRIFLAWPEAFDDSTKIKFNHIHQWSGHGHQRLVFCNYEKLTTSTVTSTLQQVIWTCWLDDISSTLSVLLEEIKSALTFVLGSFVNTQEQRPSTLKWEVKWCGFQGKPELLNLT